MKSTWPRWNLKHLTVAVAALALSFATLGVGGTAVGFVLCVPAILAPAGRRLAAWHWVAACYPMFVLFSLYTTWVVAWCALGHLPRSSLDDPKDIDAIVVPYVLTNILLVGTPFALIAALCLTVGRFVERAAAKAGDRSSSLGLVAPLAACLLGYVLILVDPLLVLDWYMD